MEGLKTAGLVAGSLLLTLGLFCVVGPVAGVLLGRLLFYGAALGQ